MTVPNSCIPCQCIPSTINDAYFKQAVLTVLCAISTGGGGGSTVNITGINGVAPSVGSGVSNTGTLRVNLASGTAGPTINEDSASTDLELITKIGFVRQAVLADSLSADGDWGWGKLDSLGRLWTSGTYLEDSPAASGDQGHPAFVQRADTEGDTTNTNGDYATLHEYDGRLSTTLRDRVTTAAIDMTAASTLAIDLDGMGSVSFYLNRSAQTGILKPQVSLDGTNWTDFYVNISELDAGAITYSNQINQINLASGNKTFTANAAGYRNFRLLVSTTGTGSLTTTIVASQEVKPYLVAIYPGTATTMLGKAEDQASASGDVGVIGFTQQQATPTNTVGTDGDYQTFKGNDVGALYVEPANKAATYAAVAFAGAAGAVPTTGVSVLTNAAKAKIITIGNTLDVAVLISLDAGSTYTYYVPATSGTAVIDLGASGRWTASNIFAKAITANSVSGTLYVGVMI